MGSRRQEGSGFSLIELMVTVAIVGILAAVAYPSYVRYRQQAVRSEATACLMAAHRQQEGFYIRNNRYTDDLDALSLTDTCGDAEQYALTIVATSTQCPLARCYELNATPQAPEQVDDGVLRLRYDATLGDPNQRLQRTRLVDGESLKW